MKEVHKMRERYQAIERERKIESEIQRELPRAAAILKLTTE